MPLRNFDNFLLATAHDLFIMVFELLAAPVCSRLRPRTRDQRHLSHNNRNSAQLLAGVGRTGPTA
jgi:hypothetical protein